MSGALVLGHDRGSRFQRRRVGAGRAGVVPRWARGSDGYRCSQLAEDRITASSFLETESDAGRFSPPQRRLVVGQRRAVVAATGVPGQNVLALSRDGIRAPRRRSEQHLRSIALGNNKDASTLQRDPSCPSVVPLALVVQPVDLHPPILGRLYRRFRRARLRRRRRRRGPLVLTGVLWRCRRRRLGTRLVRGCRRRRWRRSVF